MDRAAWAVVVPVKRLARAKTRLRGASGRVPHERLVLALAQDTVAAALGCPLVAEAMVVSDDPVAAQALAELGARVVPDRPDAGLNPAIDYAAGLVAPDRPVAALTADLPALRSAELTELLHTVAAAGVRGFVADAAGTGTTVLAVPLPDGAPGPAPRSRSPLGPGFGAGSAARHAASGARRFAGDWPSLSRDVDTAADLAAAATLGLGRHTSAVYEAALR